MHLWPTVIINLGAPSLWALKTHVADLHIRSYTDTTIPLMSSLFSIRASASKLSTLQTHFIVRPPLYCRSPIYSQGPPSTYCESPKGLRGQGRRYPQSNHIAICVTRKAAAAVPTDDPARNRRVLVDPTSGTASGDLAKPLFDDAGSHSTNPYIDISSPSSTTPNSAPSRPFSWLLYSYSIPSPLKFFNVIDFPGPSQSM